MLQEVLADLRSGCVGSNNIGCSTVKLKVYWVGWIGWSPSGVRYRAPHSADNTYRYTVQFEELILRCRWISPRIRWKRSRLVRIARRVW